MAARPEDVTTMNVSLPEGLRAFVAERATGRFSSTSEYIRELIREDQRKATQERLEQLLLDGLESGEPVEVSAEFWESKRRELQARRGRNGNA